MNNLRSQFNQQLDTCRNGTGRWVVGLSGGLDSIVLLHLAARSLPADRVLVVNVDHQLQQQSSQWAVFCEQQAASLNLPFQCKKVSVDSSASLERAAREARYQAFGEILQPDDCLLLAHHLNDQAETLLFRLLRGTGLRGLAGIPVTRLLGQARLLRPLLNIPRHELLSWAESEQLEWIEDPSNTELTFDRNYLRHKVMPLLQARWPGFAERWGETAGYLRDAEQLQNELAEIDLASVGDRLSLNCTSLIALNRPRRNNLLRYWFQQAGFSIGERQIQSVQQLISAAGDRQPELKLPGLRVLRYQGAILLHPDLPDMQWVSEPLTKSGFRVKQGLLSVDQNTGEIGLNSLSGVVVRNRRDGDRCQPIGRGGSCSLKKIFQEHKVPAWQRNSWPICVVGEQIVALPGLCVCDGWQSEKKGTGFTLKWLPTALSVRGDSDTL
ncbi:tRNA lysidine(34) synthetase TilS [Amphritea sp.]|uniref:tRNA lysidine(34) synthetase TilS n=1 Tax=Amphritea sp. TaxID=1872502 RepID=UPI0025B92D46|nr:tRNA lysidine(34) synthetase TilS [Amphritea sp.]